MKLKIFFLIVLFLAVFGDWIANEKPVYCKYQGKSYFPLFEVPFVKLGWIDWPAAFQNENWGNVPFEKVVKTLVPYSPETIDRNNLGLKSPFAAQNTNGFRDRHWMGTDRIGRDVLAGWIRGFRLALGIGFLSIFIAGLVGIFLGGLAGFYGNDRFNVPVYKAFGLFFWIIGFVYWMYLGLETNGNNLSVLIWLAIWVFIGALIYILPALGKSTSLPIDWIISLIIQAIDAIPALFFLLALLPLIKNPTLFHVIILIAFIRWTGIARLVRAEFLSIRDLEYIQAAKLLGIKNFLICWKHILPNAMGSVWITFAYSFAGAILLEAYLGYLGIGMPAGTISWGSQMQQVRENPSAWWLAVFPGLAIFLILFSLQKMGEKLESKAS
jgi:peptide/nickel transport system permease protein